MKSVRICPKCGSLVYFNSYFGAYICENCEWEDASYAKRRDSYCAMSEYRVSISNRPVVKEQRFIVKKRSATG